MSRLALALLAASLIATAPASSIAGGGSASTETYRDTRGEDAAAPDVGDIRVSNDDAGLVTFKVSIPNRPALRDDMRITIWIDADDNAASGVGGMDYRLLYDYYLHGDRTAWLLRCEASVCSNQAQPKIALTYASGPTFAVDDSLLAGTKRFRFRVVVTDGVVYDPVAKTFDLTKSRTDLAPDADPPWLYDVLTGVLTLEVTGFMSSPDPPRAGKLFTARLTVERSDTGARPAKGRAACSARVARKALPLRGRTFGGGVARCTWAVPANASGKTIRGTIAASSGGKTVAKTFARRVS